MEVVILNIDRLCPGCMNDNGGETICGICGYDASQKNEDFCLPVKYLLAERYIIGKVKGVNTEGITYIAWDNASNSAVHIREYYPKDAAIRNPDKTVSVVSGKEFSFNEGLMDFIEINKKLIATELQAIVPVLTVFEGNGTVYSVSPVISGITLSKFLEHNGGSLRWEQARPLFLPLIDTIKGLHELGIIHGGISPETILVGRDGKLRIKNVCIPRLRQASADSPAELYSGYAAAEQYGKFDAKLSVAADVYALSAMLFRVIIGAVPPSADIRIAQDSLSIPAHFADELPRQVLVAIANGLQVNPENRTKDIDEFKNELVYGETKENLRRVATARTAEKKPTQKKQEKAEKTGSGMKYAVISACVTAAVLLAIGLTILIIKWPFSKEQDFSNSDFQLESSGPSLGDVDPGAEESKMLYEVPDFVKEKVYYYELIEDYEEKYDKFTFSIKGKAYSELDSGMVCAQSIKPGKEVEFGTEIKLTISLGPNENYVPDVTGKSLEEAKLALIEKGFAYYNIEVIEKYDEEAEPNAIITQTPEANTVVSTETHIKIYINTYEGEEEPSSSTEGTVNNNEILDNSSNDELANNSSNDETVDNNSTESETGGDSSTATTSDEEPQN